MSGVVGPNESAEPTEQCAACGAQYVGAGAAVRCCSDRLRADGGQLREPEHGGDVPDDAIDPERLGGRRTPAYLQHTEHGEVFVGDYCLLESGWVRITHWDGTREKIPPHKVNRIPEVKRERHEGTSKLGGQPLKLADDEEIAKAHELIGGGQ